jgi:O-antigen ligase
MSLTAVVWFAIFVALFVLAVYRPIYGLILYFFTFFLFPDFWWWGKGTPLQGYRWNLYAGIVVMLGILRHGRSGLQESDLGRRVQWCAIGILLNATFVHFVLAPDRLISEEPYYLLQKFVLLHFLIRGAVRSRADFVLLLLALLLGAGYTGYEVTFNDRGKMDGSRLEGIGAAGVRNSNELSALYVVLMPLYGGLFFIGSRLYKGVVAVVTPMILNVLLMCNSRGAFLGAIVSAGAFLATATGPIRKKAFGGLLLGGIAVFLLLGDPDILMRFSTTFVSAEERDNSASGRLMFWTAAANMLVDHPLGAGGDGFSKAYARNYLPAVGYVERENRAVHNGIINEACEWGLQGWILRMLYIGAAVLAARRAMKWQLKQGDMNSAIMGGCLLASMAGFLMTCMFGDYLDNEWGYWIVALMTVYARLYGKEAAAETADATPVERTASEAPVRAGMPGRAAASGIGLPAGVRRNPLTS